MKESLKPDLTNIQSFENDTQSMRLCFGPTIFIQ